MSTVVAEKSTHQVREGAFGNATGLACRECGHQIALGPHYACPECFGPLEVVYDHSDLNADEAKRRIQTGSLGIWRYSDFLPFEGRPGDPLGPGMTPLVRADRLAERLGVFRFLHAGERPGDRRRRTIRRGSFETDRTEDYRRRPAALQHARFHFHQGSSGRRRRNHS